MNIHRLTRASFTGLIRRRWVVAAVTLIWCAMFAPIDAHASTVLGALSVNDRTYMWRPTVGDSITGAHDGLGITTTGARGLDRVFADSSLISGNVTVPIGRLSMTTARNDADAATITFTVEDPELGDLLWTSGHPLEQIAGDFWPGSVFAYAGKITIAGEVNGDVVAIGGDVTIREAAVVRGNVIVIGGILRQRGDAKVYGWTFAPGGHRRPRLSVSRAWEFEESGFAAAPLFSYDRVDGARFGGRLDWKTTAYAPQLTLHAGYAFASETWQFRFKVRQRLARRYDIDAEGSVFRWTDTDDDPWVGRDENTVFALVAGSDYRDYYGVDGGQVGVTYKYRERGVLSLAYRNTEYRCLGAHPNLWHLFRPDHDFRANFSTLDSAQRADLLPRLSQQTSAIVAKVAVEPATTKRTRPGLSASGNLTVEIAGGGLGGDLDYDRLMLEASGAWTGSRWHQVFLRMWYGAARRDLPPNKLFYLGGVGSLPGYPQKSLVGDEAFLATLEYRYKYWEHEVFGGAIILFFDVGRVASASRFWEWDEFKPDVGVGLAFGDDARLDVAKGLDHADRDIRVSVRFTQELH